MRFTHILQAGFFPAIPLAFFLIGAAGIGLTYEASTRQEALASIFVIVSATTLLKWYLYAAPQATSGWIPIAMHAGLRASLRLGGPPACLPPDSIRMLRRG